MIYAKVIADSVIAGKPCRITTLELQYQRFIHGEIMTHRVFSRNAMSSRAIPVAKMIQQVRENPAMPIHWGKNQPGMQAFEEALDARVFLDHPVEYDSPSDIPLFTLERTEMTGPEAWYYAAATAADTAEAMSAAGYHKQVVNRLLEPFQWMRTLVTATEWDNFFELRAHPDAQPEFHQLAITMRDAMASSVPVLRIEGRSEAAWHLPYILPKERELYRTDVLVKLSTARCARVSYLTHDGEDPDIDKDLALYDRLVGSKPLHASPAEHQARAHNGGLNYRSRNFVGWTQHRELLEAGLPC
jgi:Thymidylate synthase complementing protein